MELATQDHKVVAPTRLSGNWQMIAATVGLVVVVLLFAYFLYRFVAQTNNKLKAVEQAIHTLNDRTRQQQQQPPLQPAPAVFARHHEAFAPMQPPPVRVAPPPAPAPPVVIDAKTLDKELTEELKELSVEVPEGRVDPAAATETKAA